jgi:hypothetical protein
MKGVYKGGPLGVLSHKVKFQQDVKIYKVIAFKKKKRLFKDAARGGLYTPSHMKQNFNRTQKHEASITHGLIS